MIRFNSASAEMPFRGEDRHILDDSQRLAAVFDGVGGSYGGANAAALAASILPQLLKDVPDFSSPKEAIDYGGDVFNKLAKFVMENAEGSTTATFAKAITIREKDSKQYGAVLVGLVGDSPLYGRLATDSGSSYVADILGEQATGNQLHNAIGGTGYTPYSRHSLNDPSQPRLQVITPHLSIDRIGLFSDGITGDWDGQNGPYANQKLSAHELLAGFEIEDPQLAANWFISTSLKSVRPSKNSPLGREPKNDDRTVIITDVDFER